MAERTIGDITADAVKLLDLAEYEGSEQTTVSSMDEYAESLKQLIIEVSNAGLNNLRELDRINGILRENGYEYPLGARGVQDMANHRAEQLDELVRLDPEHWAAPGSAAGPYGKRVAEMEQRLAKQADELRAEFVRLLTQDSESKDRRRKTYNQAIFEPGVQLTGLVRGGGQAIWSSIDLFMVLSKFDRAVKNTD